MKNEFQQAVEATEFDSILTELYSAAQEIVAAYIEDGVPQDKTFDKALNVIAFIEDGESKKALAVGLNY